MTRETIDYGIDLGTTRSAIALLQGTEVEVFRNDEGFETTPSAVWLDKGGNLVVGRAARERLEMDPENAFSGFSAQMGTSAVYTFARTGRRMRSEELAAEVLKALKKAAERKTGEEVEAAVITVPAAFELPHCKATDDAAKLAGFRVSPLLQEPVAAAMAYGLQSESDRVHWLVYDLGGGTFDAAVLQVRDGIIEVVAHDGNNHLGGKLLDWAIVNQLLIPEATRDRPLADFHPGNRKWAGAMAKLKQQAETAKIRVSQDDSALIEIDYLCDDDRGDRVALEYTLTRAEVERLAEPLLRRTVGITRRVLDEVRVSAAEVEKMILVGGPTLMPVLRERLAEPEEGVGIRVETGIDPVSLIARGAAIFAGTQRLPEPPTARSRPGRLLTHSVGVALATNEVDVFFQKGSALPLRARRIYRTPFDLIPGGEKGGLGYPLVEGERARADRNRLIGRLELPCDALRGEVPAGSEVKLTLEIDATRRVRAHALFPILDQVFETVLNLEMLIPDRSTLEGDVDKETARLALAIARVQETGNPAALIAVTRIHDERIAQDVEALLAESRGQADSLEECRKRLLDLRSAIDEAEDALEGSEDDQALLQAVRRLYRQPGLAP